MTDKQTMWVALTIITLATMVHFGEPQQKKTAEEEYFICMRNQYTNHIKDGGKICEPLRTLLSKDIEQ